LKQDMEQGDQKAQLARVSGIRDDRVLTRLVALGIQPVTWAALTLVPLVEVAWADGHLTDKEREAIHRAAKSHGIEEESPPYLMLSGWLEAPPDPELREAWKDYVRELAASGQTESVEQMRHSVLGRAREVAKASGGILGIGPKISRAEQKVLDDLESVMAAPE
jgi:hypothetical protein